VQNLILQGFQQVYHSKNIFQGSKKFQISGYFSGQFTTFSSSITTTPKYAV